MLRYLSLNKIAHRQGDGSVADKGRQEDGSVVLTNK